MSTRRKKRKTDKKPGIGRNPSLDIEAPPDTAEFMGLFALALKSDHDCPWVNYFRKMYDRFLGSIPEEWEEYVTK